MAIPDSERIKRDEYNRKRRERRHAAGNAINEYNKKWYWEHLDRARARQRDKAHRYYWSDVVNNREKSRIQHREFIENHPGYDAEQKRKHREYYSQYNKLQKERRRNTPEYQAREKLHFAILNGDVVKPTTCSLCGAEYSARHIHGHHRDYSRPLDVVWLCYRCHSKEHCA